VKRGAKSARAREVEAAFARARATVATGTCPTCGRQLRTNTAIAGWWQCTGYASGACSFQTFTE